MGQLRFRDAVYAIGCSDASLKAWLNGGKCKIEAGYGEGWAEFSLKDIARLSLVNVFVSDFGMGAADAFGLACKIVEIGRKPSRKAAGEQFWAGWENYWLTLRRNHEARTWTIARIPGGSEVNAFGNFIGLDVCTVVRGAIERALERLAMQDALQRRRAV